MKLRKSKAFTLVELLVVIAILAILATVSVVGYTNFVKKAANSNDMLLAEQINTLLNGHKVYESLNNDNDIAELLQEHFESNVEIASLKYGMNIYYNTDTNKFELMDDDEATTQGYKNLAHYLNITTETEPPEITEPDDETDINEPDDFDDVIQDPSTETINFTYNTESVHLGYGRDSQDNNIPLNSYFEENTLCIDIIISYSGDVTSYDVDLSNIILASDSSNNFMDIEFKVEEIDLVNNPIHNQDSSHILTGSKLRVYTPGRYRVNCTVQGEIYNLDLQVKNVFYNQLALFDASRIEYGTITNNSLKIQNILYGITIDDYDPNTLQFGQAELSERKDLFDSITLIVKVDGTEISPEIIIDSSEYEYLVNFDSIYMSEYNILTIQFRYQAYNGTYYYSAEKTINLNK